MIAAQQNVLGGVEVIVVDSGSRDGAQAVVLESGAQLVGLAPREFSYARAHNAGATRARGAFVVRLSGDAVPARRDWLQRLLQPFDDPGVAATWGSQVLPPRLCNPFERLAQQLFYGNTRPGRRYTRDTTVLGCNLAIRRALWAAHPYDERLPQAEDYAWAHHWYRRGFATVFVPAAAVIHGHDEPWGRAFKRAFAQSALQGLIRAGVWGH